MKPCEVWVNSSPAAMHPVAPAGQETPNIRLSFSLGGWGLGATRQRLPFQRVSSGYSALFLSGAHQPAAMQSEGVAHETLVSSVDEWAGAAAGTTRQRPPLQRSAMSEVTPVRLKFLSPTAMQDCRVGHETAFSSLSIEPEGVGDGTIDHLDPFQYSVKVTGANTEPMFLLPTAKQLLASAHAIPYSLLHAAFGLGTADTRQDCLPNRSINGRYRALLGLAADAPAAKHSVIVGQETPLSCANLPRDAEAGWALTSAGESTADPAARTVLSSAAESQVDLFARSGICAPA